MPNRILFVLIFLLISRVIFSFTLEFISTNADWERNEYTSFGYSVATAGDVNNDGYSDVIVSGYNQISIYHGSESGLSETSNWGVSVNGVGSYPTVSTAGDVNGDGYSDYAVGIYNAYGTGNVLVFQSSGPGLHSGSWINADLSSGSNFGLSVACAGDVNGDGYSDLIVGARKHTNGETEEGKVMVYHGSASGIIADPVWNVESNKANALFGESVAGAGDINGDGYSDVIIGASGYSNTLSKEGAAFVYLGSATGLSTTHSWVTYSDDDSSEYGVCVAPAGDVNGDGYSDVIVGAKNYNDSGKAWIYAGSSSGLSTSSSWSVTGGETGNINFGFSVASAGDINGDGFADVMIGDPKFIIDDPGNPGTDINVGKIYVYFGKPTWPESTADYTNQHTTNNAQYGYRVSTAGDVNGDGFTELLVGAYGISSAFSYYGDKQGLSETAITGASSEKLGYDVATAGDVNGDGLTDFIAGAPDHSNQKGKVIIYNGKISGESILPSLELVGENDGDQFGYQVSEAGDVTGDGYCDVLISATNYSGGAGKVYFYKGSSTGVSSSPTWSAVGPAGSNFGCSISLAGDVNGDGFSDIVIGADEFDNNRGKVFIYHGGINGPGANPVREFIGENEGDYFGKSVSSAGDIDGDSYSDIIIGADGFSNSKGKIYAYYGKGAGLDNSAAWAIEGENNNDKYGIAVASAGDVNRDGYADLIIGASGHTNNTGRAYLYLMESQRTAPSSIWNKSGSGVNANFGFRVSTAGDINTDGFSDVIISEFGYSSNTGKVYLYDGVVGGLSADPSWTGEGLNGGDLFGHSISAAGDLNGDGYGDIVIGADGVNSDNGSLYIYSGNNGNGIDRRSVQLANSGSTLIGPGGLSGIAGGLKIKSNPKNVFGRADAKLEWELAKNGEAFGSPSTIKGEQSSFTDLATAGSELITDISGVATGFNYSWRVRPIYSYATSPFLRKGRWIYYTTYMPLACNGIKAQDEQLPVELTTFTASINNGNVNLKWETITEQNNYGFEIERHISTSLNVTTGNVILSGDKGWENIGFVKGSGNSNSQKEYSFIDDSPSHKKMQYRLKQIDIDGSFEYSNIVVVNGVTPMEFSLEQNYPNPFNPNTKISYSIPSNRTNSNSSVRLIVFDVLGNEVVELLNEKQSAGNYEVNFNASQLSSGIYFYRLSTDSFSSTKKMMLLK